MKKLKILQKINKRILIKEDEEEDPIKEEEEESANNVVSDDEIEQNEGRIEDILERNEEENKTERKQTSLMKKRVN